MSSGSKKKSASISARIDPTCDLSRLQLLHQIAGLTANVRERGLLLDTALEMLHNNFGASGCGIYQLNSPASPLHLVATQGISDELSQSLQKIPAGKGLVSSVIDTNRAHSWHDLPQAEELHHKALLDAGWQSLQAHPLIAHERLIGVLFLFQQQPRQYSQPEVELLDECCRLLASAIDASELVEKLEWQHRLTHASQRELDRSRRQLREHVMRLEESNRSLEKANQMKDRFLALASHELRTPLTWIMTAAEMLDGQRDDLPEECHILLDTIDKGSQRLNNLVEDLLEIARIEAQDIYLAQEHIDLPLMFGELSLQFGDEALRRQLSLEIGECPDHIAPVGDHHHLRQALERIMKNALKFTPLGGLVKLEAHHRTAEELLDQKREIEIFSPSFFQKKPLLDHIEICISDSGVGIAEKDRLLIFDKFQGAGDINQHGKEQYAAQGPSAGLGLPLAKGMIEAHGGMIWVDNSKLSETGSCFHILMPLYRSRKADD
ncbi:GAF domain-containing protein [Malonomonas rubra DSM 5091]|uniref:histidine kinase n=1 Tax=Malonomonas rubra DSM 5091 TaxID=1122189 RepID=A0A1M6LQL6_MALRU|nr:GAF domain-containing sensor histidine kinase [Malonomonas rubra]SHJ73493.1 GAF domain-containing protein [Malonomonas rubra DSM 5091]